MNERQKVRLAIYDLAGHRVRTLVDGELAAGDQIISWDGRDQQGRSMASGVYFYELAAGNQIERKKMTLVR
jgi:flagellar hook assembly protein FlgD